MYAVAAQYNHPPRYPVTVVCGGIDGAPEGSDILSRIFAGVVAYRGNRSCYNTSVNPTETSEGWRWQVTTYLYDNNTKYNHMVISNIYITLLVLKYFMSISHGPHYQTEPLFFGLGGNRVRNLAKYMMFNCVKHTLFLPSMRRHAVRW